MGVRGQSVWEKVSVCGTDHRRMELHKSLTTCRHQVRKTYRWLQTQGTFNRTVFDKRW